MLQGEPGSESALEARLDVHMLVPTFAGSTAPADEWIDVTVVHPWKLATRGKAASQPGVAARLAAERKVKKYGAGVGGVAVRPFAVETWGKFDPEASGLIDLLACAWAERVHASPQRAAAQKRRWMENVGFAVVRSLASTAAQASARVRDDSASEQGL